MIETIKHQYPAISWAILVLILCDMPVSGAPSVPLFEGVDKLVHTGFFFVLTVLMFYGKIRQEKNRPLRPGTIAKICIATIAFGGFIELLQWRVFTYRSAEWWDFLCDAAGVGMAVFSYFFLHRPRHTA